MTSADQGDVVCGAGVVRRGSSRVQVVDGVLMDACDVGAGEHGEAVGVDRGEGPDVRMEGVDTPSVGVAARVEEWVLVAPWMLCPCVWS